MLTLTSAAALARRLWLLPVTIVTAALIVGFGSLIYIPVHSSTGAAGEPIVIHVEARQFAFTPGVVRVPLGSRVRIELDSRDVTHGLRLDSHDVSLTALPGSPASAEFVADQTGRFAFACTATCGQLHPFMVGELVVEPNRPFGTALGLLALAAVTGALIGRGGGTAESGRSAPSIDLTRWRVVRWVVRRRFIQEGIAALLLAGLTLVSLAGALGSPVGSHNGAIVFVWIVWWGILKLVLIPFGGRAWCAVCPLPKPGEWVQRRTIVGGRPDRPLGLGRAWPRRLRGLWIAVAMLFAMGVASAPILTSPTLTAALLGGMALLALALALVYRGRVFCRYVCPVGSFVGLYSLAAPLGVRPVSRDVCAAHTVGKECLGGSPTAHGCPWLIYPGGLERNADCGLCLECLRGCSKSNLGLVLQPPGVDLVPCDGQQAAWPRPDEAYAAIAMAALAGIYHAIFLGPWGELKRAALLGSTGDFAAHTLLVVGGAGLVAPLLWLGVAALARTVGQRTGDRPIALGRVWAATAYALIPFGMLAWIAFTISFVLANGGYVATAIADPLGLGWDLGGLRAVAAGWRLPGADVRVWLQVAVWTAGLGWSVGVAARIARRLFGDGLRSTAAGAVVAIGLLAMAGGLAWLGLG